MEEMHSLRAATPPLTDYRIDRLKLETQAFRAGIARNIWTVDDTLNQPSEPD